MRERLSQGSREASRPTRLALAGALALSLAGCSQGVLAPAGPISDAERTILLDSVAIMLAIVIPVIVATLAFAWWFRSSNDRATHLPSWSYSGRLEFIVWSIPAMVVLFLAGIGWVGSHDLDPAQRIGGKPPALEVQVVALDWKWLFIYPGQGVASVNQLVLPAGQPVAFRLTSASVMNSFFIPRLGSQIYAMAGMATRLNLEADKPGVYPGLSAQFSGDGFSGMNFNARVVTPAQFAAWVGAARTGPPLDLAAYERLVRPSENVPPLAWGAVAPDLFTHIVDMTAPGVAQKRPPPAPTAPRGPA